MPRPPGRRPASRPKTGAAAAAGVSKPGAIPAADQGQAVKEEAGTGGPGGPASVAKSAGPKTPRVPLVTLRKTMEEAPSVPCAEGQILPLEDPEHLIFVDEGVVDVFALGPTDLPDLLPGRQFLCRLSKGALLPGREPGQMRLAIAPLGHTKLKRVDWEQLDAITKHPTDDKNLAWSLDCWLWGVSEAIERWLGADTDHRETIAAEECLDLAPRDRVSARKAMVWVHLEKGAAKLLDRLPLPVRDPSEPEETRAVVSAPAPAPEAEPEAEPEAAPESEAPSASEQRPEPKPEATPEPEPEPAPKAEAEPEPEPDPPLDPPLDLGRLPLPLHPKTWVSCSGPTRLRGRSTRAMLAERGWRQAIEAYTGFVLDCVVEGLAERQQAEEKRHKERFEQVGQDVGRVLDNFANVVRKGEKIRSAAHGGDPLLTALQMLGDELGIEVRSPRHEPEDATTKQKIEGIAKASNMALREVALRDDWWAQDNGPLLLLESEDQAPRALLPDWRGRYFIIDPEKPLEKQPLTAAAARRFRPIAYQLYAPLPVREVTVKELLLFGLAQSRRDLMSLLFWGLIGALVGLAAPAASAYLFNAIIPDNARGELVILGAALLVAAFSAFTVKIVSDLASLRIEGRVAARVQGAVIHRVLSMPQAFLEEYTTADLTLRTLATEMVRRALTGVFIGSMVGGLFALSSLALLFYFSTAAALVAIGLAGVLALMTVTTGRAQVKAIFEGEAMNANVISFIFQLINGMSLLRIYGAENKAFARWGEDFLEMRARLLRSRKMANLFDTFYAGYEVLAMAAVFAAIALLHTEAGAFSGEEAEEAEMMSSGTFIAFVAAFSGFLMASGQIAKAMQGVYQIMPLMRRARSILETVPELGGKTTDPGSLSGAVEANNIFYRYSPEGSWVLDGVSVSIKSGEFVAFVGPSGCGKSTMMKALLGLVVPESGGIFYDNQDLRKLDPQAVRRQIGVVTQQSKLFPASIYENVAGASGASLDEVWEALELAGLASDIRAMPMEIHTVLTEGSAGLSGGQVQRLLIARALVAQPRILMFDEATSALDNKTQALVTETLDRMAVTRIVIAHRLVTVEKCDRIYVMNEGRIVQSGSYRELLEEDGLFQDLARRQLV